MDQVPSSVDTPESTEPRRRKRRAKSFLQPTRERLPRGASNPDRLSSLVIAETSYHSRAKRGVDDDLADLFPKDDVRESASATVLPRGKKTKRGILISASAQEPLDGGSAPRPGPRATRDDSTPSVPATSRQDNQAATPKGIKKPARIGVKKPQLRLSSQKADGRISGASATRKPSDLPPPVEGSARPGKRRRTGTKEASTSIDAAAPQVGRRTGVPARRSASVSAVSVDSANTTRKHKRKRGVSHEDSAPAAASVASSAQPQRVTVKLPKRNAATVKEPKRRAPQPAPATLGIPATLAEADKAIGDIAAGALLLLNNTAPAPTQFTRDPAAQDDPPDSDEEEEVPQSSVPSARPARVRSGEDDDERPSVAVVSAPGMRMALELQRVATSASPTPGASVLPSPSVASTSHTPFTFIPNPIGKRVPRPVPPDMPPKPPLTAQPLIWAKVRWYSSLLGV